MNLNTLTAVAAQFAGDQGQSRYSGLYTQAINLAQQQFALDSKCLWKDAPTYTVVSGTAGYSLPTDFMWEKQITHKGLALQPISRHEILRIKSDVDWTTESGTPTHYIIDPEEARKQITLYRNPNGDAAGANLVLTYYPLPADLASGTDTPLNSSALLSQFHVGLGAWAAWYLMQSEQDTDSVVRKKKELLQIYNDSVTVATDTFKNTVSEGLRQRGGRVYR